MPSGYRSYRNRFTTALSPRPASAGHYCIGTRRPYVFTDIYSGHNRESCEITRKA